MRTLLRMLALVTVTPAQGQLVQVRRDFTRDPGSRGTERTPACSW